MGQLWVRIPPGGLITFILIVFCLITLFYVRSGDHQSVPNPEILSTMVGENFEIHMYEMARNIFKLSTMVEENFEIYISNFVPRNQERRQVVVNTVINCFNFDSIINPYFTSYTTTTLSQSTGYYYMHINTVHTCIHTMQTILHFVQYRRLCILLPFFLLVSNS